MDRVSKVVLIGILQVWYLSPWGQSRPVPWGVDLNKEATYEFLDLAHVVLERFTRAKVQVANDLALISPTPLPRLLMVSLGGRTLLTLTRPAILHPSVFCSFIFSVHPSSVHCSMPSGSLNDHPLRT